jgi:hypothetical protein
MMIALIAAGLFAAHQVVPAPGAARVAIVGNRMVPLPAGAKFGVEPFGWAAAGPDLVIANHTQKQLTIVSPDGSKRTVQLPIEPHAHSVAAADFDGDGQVDLVVNDMAGHRALILWAPKFETMTPLPSGSKGNAYLNVAAADFDGDGHTDVVIANWPRSEVSLLLNAGKRSFRAARVIQLPNPAFYVAAADVDGDGKADLLVATYSGSTADLSRDGLIFLKGDGHGGFAKPLSLPAGPAPTMLAVGDVDGDGIADVAVCDQAGQQVTLFFKGLHSSEIVHTNAPPTGIALGDLDGDGKADLAVATGDAVELFLTKPK